ncbi:MAG: tetratricopeptide repeat protein [Cyclobacteriaceae bacterium]
MERKHLISVCLVAVVCHLGFGQTRLIDSLKIELTKSQGLERVPILNEISWELKNINVDSAFYYGQLALKESTKLNDASAMAASFNSIASAYEALGKLDSAEVYLQSALEIQLQNHDSLKIADSYNNLGIVYDQKGQYDLALSNYFKSLKYYEESSDDAFDIAKVLGNIGVVYKKQQQYGLVLDYYEKALNIYEELGSDFGIAVTQGNIGSVMINLKNYEESKDFSNKAMAGYKSLGYDRYVPYILFNLGAAEDSLHHYQLAKKYYSDALDQHRLLNNPFEEAATSMALAKSYLKTNDYRRAATFADNALTVAGKVNANEIMVSASQVLALAEAKSGNYQKAFDDLMAHLSGKDSLFEKSKTELIFDLQTKYETEKKEQEIAIQQLQLAEKDLTIERNVYMQAAMGVFIAGLIGLGFLQRSRQKHKERHLIADEKRKMQAQQIDAILAGIEKERKRFAEDLHDGFGQYLSILRMNIDSIQSKKEQPMDERVKLFEHSENILKEMGVELKNICFNLMPKTLIQHGIDAALKEFGLKINQAGKVKIDIITHGFDESNRLTEVQEISFYRISQEWVNNILKYGQASQITLQLLKDETEISLTIEDDGPGFEPQVLEQGKGNGWKNIQSRANLINAELELDTRVGVRGSTLMVNAEILNLKEVLL